MTADDILRLRLEQVEKRAEALEGEMKAMKAEADKLEKQRLRWGISALGTVVMLLGTVLWGYRGVIFK